MNAMGTPFAREYGGSLATRSFGGVQVSRTYYSRGQTGQQLQIAASQALQRQVQEGTVRLHTRTEMLDVIVADGRARGVVTRDLVTGEVRATTGHAVVLATGGYGNVFFRSTLAKNSNASAGWRAHLRGALFASPSFIQSHPTALPVNSEWQSKTILMSESLRNDGRIWVPKNPGDDRDPNAIPENERDYYLERMYPAFGNLSRATCRRARLGPRSRPAVASVRWKTVCTWTSGMRWRGWERTPSRSATATCSTCTATSPARTPTGCRCGSRQGLTSAWAGCGAISTR